MRENMAPRTRLDPALKLQEHRETHSLQVLADANRQAAAADEALLAARKRAAHDQRLSGALAADWQIAESAHAKALAEVATAQRSAQAAAQAAGTSRNHYIAIHAKAEALRRLLQARREEAVRIIDAAETRETEELFLMRRARS